MKRYVGSPALSREPGREWRKPDGLAPNADMGGAFDLFKVGSALNIKGKQHIEG
jgi:hypothetical protein